ncbi:MAG: nitronate monooxygenase [Flavobacteriales bacterium]|nr:nitronate monooxygenase [Flavobacteriales bacterium]
MADDRLPTALTELLNIRYPVIMAPMFLVSNTEMVKSAIESGITGAIPALNYRTTDELRAAIQELKATGGSFGINLIVNKSNFRFEEQLAVCCELRVDFIITSLGSPERTIQEAHNAGVKVFCDVTDLKYALKVEALGADALIAVNNLAGGHAGHLPPEELIPELVKNCSIPVVSAGGVGNRADLDRMLNLGAAGASVGSVFIATNEAPVSAEYKQAIVDYGANDIVMTTKLSGTPCTVINTPYVQEIGTKQNHIQRVLNRNKRLKKWFKAITFIRGMQRLRNAAFDATYKTVWCAGPTIEHVHEIRPVADVVNQLIHV